jgi:RecA-family ATPase
LENLMDDDRVKIPELSIDGLLPKQGLLLLGGRPKEGKSWLACQIALSFATGQALGGWLKVCEPGRVQLWALEDQYAITKDKMGKLLHGTRPDGLRDIKIFAELRQPILRGGDAIIRAALREHPSELIILDSLFKLSGGSQGNYDIGQRDYDVIDRVRKIALEHNCSAIIIMHTKKGAPGGNPIENLLGTTGTTAAPDAVAELKRYKQGSGKLTVVGRSVQSDDYELAWHGGPDAWGWTIQEQGDQEDSGETSDEVLAYLDAQGASSPATIASALRKSFQSVWNALNRLRGKQRVIRRTDRKWELAK